MKKGIVRVPEWAKEAVRSGCVITVDGVEITEWLIGFDGKTLHSDDPDWPVSPSETLESFPESWIEPIQEPVQWDRIKVDAPIEVKVADNWINAHFAASKDGIIYYYADGKTSHTAKLRGVEFGGSLLYSTKEARFPEDINPEDWYRDE